MKRLLKTKYIIACILSLIGLITLQNCERDDICAESTATTPRLLVEFYDISNTDDLKNVPRITVYGEGLVTDPTVESDATLLYNVNANTVELPLIIDIEGETVTTRFVLEKDTNLRLDTDDTTNSNKDTIEIRYVPEFIFVSRACGYKSIFNSLDVVSVSDGDNWISSSSIEVLESETVENENTVHVKIYH